MSTQDNAQKLTRLRDEATRLLGGLKVVKVLRLVDNEVVIEFDGGTRLLVNSSATLDISIT